MAWHLDALFYVTTVGNRMNWRVALGTVLVVDVWMPCSLLPEQRIVDALCWAMLGSRAVSPAA